MIDYKLETVRGTEHFVLDEILKKFGSQVKIVNTKKRINYFSKSYR